MAESAQSAGDSLRGAIDLMYFPPAGNSSSMVVEDRCHEPVQPVVALKKECGLDYVFVTECKRWACDRRVFCEDGSIDDILRYTAPYPEHFIGIGSYNPFEIARSTQENEIGIRTHGFRGIYVHTESFGISPNDRRMYPLYVKALEWQVPVILDLRLTAGNTRPVRVTEMEQIASDFSDLSFVAAQSQWVREEMARLADNFANVHFCFDVPALHIQSIRSFVNSSAGQSRCMWGSNGLPWKEALADVARLTFANSTQLFRENALQLFGLDRLTLRPAMAFIESEDAPTRITAE
jgi:predicted TIM-barrel fold metal-dependent hydrolase